MRYLILCLVGLLLPTFVYADFILGFDLPEQEVAPAVSVPIKPAPAAGKDIKAVRAKGFLQVGVNGGVFGFSMPDAKGVWKGLDVDTARAVAAALFGDASRVKYTPLTALQRFVSLQAGQIDVLIRNTAKKPSREDPLGLKFVTPNYYDGQGFMVAKNLGVKSAHELSGATVCVLPGTTTEQNIAEFFRANHMTWKPVVIESTRELAKTFFAGRCDVLTADATQLAGVRAVAPNPGNYIILPEIITREILAPVVRQGDALFHDIVDGAVRAMIYAEELGITSDNVDAMRNSRDPAIRRFLGVVPGVGVSLDLDDRWAYNIIKQVGNYGEVFERNLGRSTVLGIERGLNALSSNGGLMHSPPFN